DKGPQPREIAARTARARDESVGNGIVGRRDDDGDRLRRLARGLDGGRARGHDDVHADAEELLRVAGEELELPLGVAVPRLGVPPRPSRARAGPDGAPAPTRAWLRWPRGRSQRRAARWPSRAAPPRGRATRPRTPARLAGARA